MALCLIACLLPTRRRWALLAAGLALTLIQPLLTGWLFGERYELPLDMIGQLLLVYSTLLPVMLLTSLWWWEIVVDIDKHRQSSAELAVAEERLRFAADLHDIQGHHLQVIALKAELAERLLDIDLDAARDNIRESRLIAKQALKETRMLVSGYREVSLDYEIENAREVLSAAGAKCELHLSAPPENPEVCRVFAMTVREATTNILRHSNATTAAIRLRADVDCYSLTIGNNGVESSDDSRETRGFGLKGLRERVVSIGGQLSAHASGDNFVLLVEVPARIEAT